MGYLAEFEPDHPSSTRFGLVFQHRLVAEHVLGRFLTRQECVHHENEVKTNNDPSNLWVFPSTSAHQRHHKRSSPRYSQELATRLLPLAADERVSFLEASRALGVSKPVLKYLLDANGIPWVDAQSSHLAETQVREALAGRSTKEAARLLGVNHQTLRNRFPQLLTKRASPRSVDAHKEEIRSLATHMRADELAPRFGLCGETIRSAIRQWCIQEPDAWSGVSVFQRSRAGLGRPPGRKASGPSHA